MILNILEFILHPVSIYFYVDITSLFISTCVIPVLLISYISNGVSSLERTIRKVFVLLNAPQHSMITSMSIRELLSAVGSQFLPTFALN